MSFLALGVDVLLSFSQLALTLLVTSEFGKHLSVRCKDQSSFSTVTFSILLSIAAGRTEQPSPVVPCHNSLINAYGVSTSAISPLLTTGELSQPVSLGRAARVSMKQQLLCVKGTAALGYIYMPALQTG